MGSYRLNGFAFSSPSLPCSSLIQILARPSLQMPFTFHISPLFCRSFQLPGLKNDHYGYGNEQYPFQQHPSSLQAMSICCAIYIDSLHGRPLPLQFILPFIPPISIPSSFPSSFLVFGGLSQRHLSPFLHIEESSSPQLV
jgi:hypothetical protein